MTYHKANKCTISGVTRGSIIQQLIRKCGVLEFGDKIKFLYVRICVTL
jgi:hypothetical protein